MPGIFAYDEATNKIVVTNGTEGAPATFNDMYLADQAGTDTILLDAGTPASDLALDYAVRPTHNKALKVKCVVANKSAEADYIFITGTNFNGDAQTEAIDVAAGDGSYETTKYWASITTLDCSDNAAGGGAVWADGDLTVTQDIWGVVWEYVADGQYKIDCNVNFGNGSTATYFTSKNEVVYFADDVEWVVLANATLHSGTLEGGYSINGSSWSVGPSSSMYFSTTGGTVKFYGSFFKLRTAQILYLYNATVDIRDSIIVGLSRTEGQIQFSGSSLTYSIRNSVICNFLFINLYGSPIVLSNTYFHYISTFRSSFYDTTLENCLVTSYVFSDAKLDSANTITLKNPKNHVITPQITDAGGVIIEQYTCNIHIADEDGADLAGVTVQCQTFGNVVSNDAGTSFYKCIVGHTSGVFADDLTAGKWELTTAAYAAKAGCTGGAGTGAWVTGTDYVAAASEFSVATDANGDIAEQTIDYKKWVGTSEALLTFGPFTFTYTHADYPDYVMNDITVDHPIVWSIEMGISTANITAACSASTPSVTVSDKTGFSLSTAGILAIWHQALAQIVTASTIGKKIKDWVLGTDNKALISTDSQDLSATLDVNAKLLNGATPNNAITAPTTGEIRTELATELGRIDAAITTRNSVVPDAAGTAADLHTITDGKIDANKTILDTLDGLVEDDDGDRFTEKALEQAPTAEMDATEFAAALLAVTGVTEGGTWTFAKVMKVINAFAVMKMQLKTGTTATYEILDPDDGTTVIAELTTNDTSPPTISILI